MTENEFNRQVNEINKLRESLGLGKSNLTQPKVVKKTRVKKNRFKNFKNWVILFLKKIYKPIGTFIDKKIKAPMRKRTEIKATRKAIINIKKQFSIDFNSSCERVIENIKIQNDSIEQTDNDYLKETLVLGAKHCGEVVGKSPRLYVPEVIDIHNENINPLAPSIHDINKLDSLNVLYELNKQTKAADMLYGNSTRVKHGETFESKYLKHDTTNPMDIRDADTADSGDVFKKFTETLIKAKQNIGKSKDK